MIYVTDRNNDALLGFDASANGNTAPVTAVEGSKTTFGNPDALGFDGVGSLYVINDSGNSAAVFPTGATGNVAPSNVLTSSNPLRSEGITFDASGNAYVSSYSSNEVDIFPKGAFGTQTPAETISGSNTTLAEPEAMVVDSSGTLYVVNLENTGNGYSSQPIVMFANPTTTSGNVAPVAYIGGSNTMLQRPAALAIDRNGRLIVGDYYAGILIFAKGATGNVAPTAVISGSATDIGTPLGITVDASNNIWESDGGTPELLEFAPTANGNAAPIAQISGSATTLSGPAGIVFVPGADVQQTVIRRPQPPKK